MFGLYECSADGRECVLVQRVPIGGALIDMLRDKAKSTRPETTGNMPWEITGGELRDRVASRQNYLQNHTNLSWMPPMAEKMRCFLRFVIVGLTPIVPGRHYFYGCLSLLRKRTDRMDHLLLCPASHRWSIRVTSCMSSYIYNAGTPEAMQHGEESVIPTPPSSIPMHSNISWEESDSRACTRKVLTRACFRDADLAHYTLPTLHPLLLRYLWRQIHPLEDDE